MPRLVLGPLLRYVSEREATVWVETDAPCEVVVLDHGARTFEVEGHHYALVRIEGLSPGTASEYEVALDGERAWPPPQGDFPPSLIRTLSRDRPVRISFGSCRVAYPHRPPYSLPKDEHPEGREVDALYALARRMRGQPHERWPHLLLLLGDQVYADEASPRVREFISERRDPAVAPGYEVADFEEYVRLYYETWGDTDPSVRWLLSTVSTAMVWDDHDVHDDWNTSQSWLEEMRRKPWWERRISSGVMSYWLYQHLGNLEPHQLDDDEMYDRVLRCEGDAGPMLRDWAHEVAHEVEGARWSYKRDLCGARLVMMDSRGGRVLDPERRAMVERGEWCFIEECARGGVDHLLLGTSMPWLLPPAMHWLEAWNEAVCAGAWGRTAAVAAEKIRRKLDLEHWAAFQRSFEAVERLVRSVGSGARGAPPASIVALSGDVHHAYLMEAGFRPGDGVESGVFQAVCSPFRNPLDRHERATIRLAASSRTLTAVLRSLALAAGVREPQMRWRPAGGRAPWFDNQVATLELHGRRARLLVEKTIPDDWVDPSLEVVLDRSLAG